MSTPTARLEDFAWGFDYGWRAQPVSVGQTRFVRTADLDRDTQQIDWVGAPFCSEEPPQTLLVGPSDILIARNGAGSIGNSAVVQNIPGPASFSSNLIRLIPKTREVGRYLGCFLRSSQWFSEIERLSSGAAIPNISAKKLRTISIPVLGEHAQAQAIELCEEAGRNAIEARIRIARARDALRLVAATAANEAARGRLQQLIVTLRRSVEEISTDSSVETGEVDAVDLLVAPWRTPETWEWRTFGEVCENFNSKRKALNASERSLRSGDIPYLGASGEIDRINEYLLDGEFLLISEDGSNLRTRRGPISYVIRGKFWAGNHVHVSRPGPDIISEFLALVVNRTALDDRLTGVAQPKLPRGRLNTLPVPVPPRAEQQALLSAWAEVQTPILEIEARLEIADAEVSRLLATQIAGVFSGELVAVSERQAKDQLASLRGMKQSETLSPSIALGRPGGKEKSSTPSTKTQATPTNLWDVIVDAVQQQKGPVPVEDLFARMQTDLSRADEFFHELWGLTLARKITVSVSKKGRGQASILVHHNGDPP